MTLHAVTMAVFGFYGSKPGEDPRIGKISKILGAVAVLCMAWLFAAYFGLAHLLPRPVLSQKIFSMSTEIWLVSCAVLMMRTTIRKPSGNDPDA